MTVFSFGDIVRARFPHVERAVIVTRPAVVLASWPTPVGALLWVAMVTNAQRAPWPGDVEIEDALERGLILPSKIRAAKVAAIAADGAVKLGTVGERARAELRLRVEAALKPD